jgi:hypothetical protein
VGSGVELGIHVAIFATGIEVGVELMDGMKTRQAIKTRIIGSQVSGRIFNVM